MVNTFSTRGNLSSWGESVSVGVHGGDFNKNLLFLPHFLGAQRSEWLLLPKRAAALWEGPTGLAEEPGKQKTRSCRTQELARSSARENEWQKKSGLTRLNNGRHVERTKVGKHNGRRLENQLCLRSAASHQGGWDSYCEWQRLNAVARNRRRESAKWGSRRTQELARSSA